MSSTSLVWKHMVSFFATLFKEGKLQSQKTPIKVSHSFYLLSADDTYLVFGPMSISAFYTAICFSIDLGRHFYLFSYP